MTNSHQTKVSNSVRLNEKTGLEQVKPNFGATTQNPIDVTELKQFSSQEKSIKDLNQTAQSEIAEKNDSSKSGIEEPKIVLRLSGDSLSVETKGQKKHKKRKLSKSKQNKPLISETPQKVHLHYIVPAPLVNLSICPIPLYMYYYIGDFWLSRTGGRFRDPSGRFQPFSLN